MTLRPAICLRFFVHTNARHGGRLLYEWLLERAREVGIGGGSAFRAIAGFGRHGVLHEEHFFELADDLPLKVEFIVDTAQADALLALVRKAGVELVFTRHDVEFGVIERRPA